MCAGNLLALRQNHVKRVLAYSSIAHFGYILVVFLARTTIGGSAVDFYLVAYTVTLLAAFGIVTVLSSSEDDAGDLEDYRGLFWRRPVIAVAFTVVLFSLAGILATMGFLGKEGEPFRQFDPLCENEMSELRTIEALLKAGCINARLRIARETSVKAFAKKLVGTMPT